MPTTLERVVHACVLPELDGIVISRGHYDHCGLGALASYPDRDVPMVVNRGTGQPLKL
jgi:L-ascorbate metabolism protein UlaG (beta-lactamase superfamily)